VRNVNGQAMDVWLLRKEEMDEHAMRKQGGEEE
jgi:hypothetical protein